MQGDIDRIKKANLQHIDTKLIVTTNVLGSLEAFLGNKNLSKGKQNWMKAQPLEAAGTAQQDLHTMIKTRQAELAKRVRQLKEYVGLSDLGSQYAKFRKQVVKYFTGVVSAKQKTISRLEKALEDSAAKSLGLEARLAKLPGQSIPTYNKFCQTMPSNPNGKGSRPQINHHSMSTTRREEAPMEYITTQLCPGRQADDDFVKVRSEILQKWTDQKKTMSLVDISEEINFRENQQWKASTNRDRANDLTPALPKPLRKASQQKGPSQQKLIQNIGRSKMKSRHLSIHELQPPAPSHRTRPTGGDMFKGKRALLAASDMSSFLGKNR